MIEARSVLVALVALVAVTATATNSFAQTATDSPGLRAAAARVSPGDRILLQVAREPELSDSIAVTERGEAAFPKLGMLQVASLTIGELQDTLYQRYSQFLRAPVIQMKVLRRVAVHGEVRMGGVFFVDLATTLREVIARAGGVAENGHRGKVYIIRDGTRVHVKNWESEQGAVADLRSGDQVVVGRKNWLVINALPAISTAVVLGSFVITMADRARN